MTVAKHLRFAHERAQSGSVRALTTVSFADCYVRAVKRRVADT